SLGSAFGGTEFQGLSCCSRCQPSALGRLCPGRTPHAQCGCRSAQACGPSGQCCRSAADRSAPGAVAAGSPGARSPAEVQPHRAAPCGHPPGSSTAATGGPGQPRPAHQGGAGPRSGPAAPLPQGR
ncbi:MAG: hypothetical protein ACK56F_20400, partial [bacterium]